MKNSEKILDRIRRIEATDLPKSLEALAAAENEYARLLADEADPAPALRKLSAARDQASAYEAALFALDADHYAAALEEFETGTAKLTADREKSYRQGETEIIRAIGSTGKVFSSIIGDAAAALSEEIKTKALDLLWDRLDVVEAAGAHIVGPRPAPRPTRETLAEKAAREKAFLNGSALTR